MKLTQLAVLVAAVFGAYMIARNKNFAPDLLLLKQSVPPPILDKTGSPIVEKGLTG